MGASSSSKLQSRNQTQTHQQCLRNHSQGNDAEIIKNIENKVLKVDSLIGRSSKDNITKIKEENKPYQHKNKKILNQLIRNYQFKASYAANPKNVNEFVLINPQNKDQIKKKDKFSQSKNNYHTNQKIQEIVSQKSLIKHDQEKLERFDTSNLLQWLQILQISEEQANDFDQLRLAFAQRIRKYSELKNQLQQNIQIKRQNRAKILLAFFYLSNKIFNTTYETQSEQFLHSIFKGNTTQVKKMIDKNPQLLLFRTKGNNYPLLYIASMTGHTDLVQMIIKTGHSLNFQKDRSTPFHAAAWYNHYHIAKILLDYGIPHYIKNTHGEIPIQNAQGQLYDLLIQAGKNKFTQLTHSLIVKKLCKTVINVKHQGKTIIRKILLKNYDNDFTQYVDAFHGTKFQNMQSITIHGLKKPGTKILDKQIQVQKNNIQLGRQYHGDLHWANKIYVTPSIHYAALYSDFEYFLDERLGRQTGWKSIVQVKVRKGSYKQYGDTTGDYERVNNEPKSLQYQIEDDRNVEVVALMLVKRNWLGHYFSQRNRDYNQTSVIILQSEEEQIVRAYSESIVIPAPQD